MSRKIIRTLGELSDAQLATPLAKQCTEFAQEDHSDEETTRFLRDLRDLCVHYGGASSFVMAAIAALLPIPDSEPEEDCKQRRASLMKRYGVEESKGRCPECGDLLTDVPKAPAFKFMSCSCTLSSVPAHHAEGCPSYPGWADPGGSGKAPDLGIAVGGISELSLSSSGRVGCLRCDYSRPVGEAEPTKEMHFQERKDGLWEKIVDGETVGLFRTIETRPPEWPGDDSSEEKQLEWRQEAERRMDLADAPGVEMFFAAGKGPIPDITFVEPVEEPESR